MSHTDRRRLMVDNDMEPPCHRCLLDCLFVTWNRMEYNEWNIFVKLCHWLGPSPQRGHFYFTFLMTDTGKERERESERESAD